MLKILHKGINYNAPLDQTGFTGDVDADSKLASVQALVGGRLVAIRSTGVALADSASDVHVAGFVINDAAGYFFENKPALASGLVPIATGNQVVATDQIVSSETFAIGDLLYVGTGANAGLVTKTKPGTGLTEAFGQALSEASAASPELTILVF